MPHDKEKRGFSGLDSLVSNVEIPYLIQDPPLARETSDSKVQKDQAPQNIYEGKPTASKGSPGIWWLVGIAIVGFIIWAGDSKTNNPAPSITHDAPAAAHVPEYPPNAAPARVSKEVMPPVGSGLELNRNQIRYCLSEDVRLSAWQGKVNQYSDASVDAFNAAVNDYNSRCSKFRYRSGLLESVRAEVEANRLTLISQGTAKAAANP